MYKKYIKVDLSMFYSSHIMTKTHLEVAEFSIKQQNTWKIITQYDVLGDFG